jgi:hypothetical protein
MGSLYVTYGIRAGGESIDLPITSVSTSTTTTVSFTIRNPNLFQVRTSYEIREGSVNGTIRGSASNILYNANETKTVTSTSVSANVSYFLVGVSARSEADSSLVSTVVAPISSVLRTVNPSILSVSSGVSSVSWTVRNNANTTAIISTKLTSEFSWTSFSLGSGATSSTQTRTGLSAGTNYTIQAYAEVSGRSTSDLVATSVSTCDANNTYLGTTCSGTSRYELLANGNCGTKLGSLIQSNDGGCICESQGGNLAYYDSGACNGNSVAVYRYSGSGTSPNCGTYFDGYQQVEGYCGYSPGPTCSDLAGDETDSYCMGTTLVVFTYTGAGTYPNCNERSDNYSNHPSCSGPTCSDFTGQIVSSSCQGTTLVTVTYTGGGTYPNCSTTSSSQTNSPSCGGGGCLDENTPIPMWDGTTKLLKDVERGDALVGYYIDDMIDEDIPGWENWKTSDPLSGIIIPVTVVFAAKDTYDSYFIINNEIKITKKHRFFANNGVDISWSWIDSSELQQGYKIMSINKEIIVISSIELINKKISVVTLDVEETDCYFAGTSGILVHNQDVSKA